MTQTLPKLSCLADLTPPPNKLFYKGKLDMKVFDNCVAVVGSRKITDYGKRVIEKLVPQLVFEKKTIVSGFMYGVDQYAHQVAIDSGGKTIAVLGWGINVKLYDFDAKLAKKIIDSNGLLVSEWETQQAALWTFPLRNRIVAGLSKEVYIIEAAENSGSLITARLAIKLKRKLFAVPGPITSKTSEGTNNLIARGEAQMWLAHFAKASRGEPKNDPILDILGNEALTTDEIARKLNKPVAEIGTSLSILLLTGVILEKNGKYYLNDVN